MRLLFRDFEIATEVMSIYSEGGNSWRARVTSVWETGNYKIMLEVYLTASYARVVVCCMVQGEEDGWWQLYALSSFKSGLACIYSPASIIPVPEDDYRELEEFGKQRAIMILDGA